jgi:hypothetical protein
VQPIETDPYANLGIEYSFRNVLFLRTGLSGKDRFGRYSAGLGFAVNKTLIDMSFRPSDLEDSYSFTVLILNFCQD